MKQKGIASFDDLHRKSILPKFVKDFPRVGNLDYPIWSGACYVMPRDFRQLMRKQINPAMRRVFELISPRSYVDEGMFHVMCHKADLNSISILTSVGIIVVTKQVQRKRGCCILDINLKLVTKTIWIW